MTRRGAAGGPDLGAGRRQRDGGRDRRICPPASRNFTGLVALLPGVVYNAAADSSSDSVTINGQHGSGVVFLMDGGSNNDDLRGGSSGAQARPPLESIQEFQVVTNQFDAEYGAATAGVVNAVTKQGTNAWHGSAIGYFTDSSMTARDFFVDAAGPGQARHPQEAVGRHDRRADRPRQDALLRQLRAAGSRRGPQPHLPDASGSQLHASRRRPTPGTTWGASIISSTPSNNYSVRFLWDHQPNYNQVLADGDASASTARSTR